MCDLYKDKQPEMGEPQVLADCFFCKSNSLDFTSLLQLLLYLLRALLQNSDASPLVAVPFSHLLTLFCSNESHKVQIISSWLGWVK